MIGISSQDAMKTKRCCCLVPCYNEAERVGNVLKVLIQLDNCDQIICVDDGSTDNTSDVIRREYPQIILLRSDENLGKTGAVHLGAQKTDCEYIFLVDADLRNIKINEFDAAIATVKEYSEIDLLILRRIKKDRFSRMMRGDILITGERIIRTEDLLDILQSNKIDGYQLEVAINQYMLERRKIVRWMPVSSVGIMSLRKIGVWPGLKKEILMFPKIYSYLGIRKTIMQFLFFGREALDHSKSGEFKRC